MFVYDIFMVFGTRLFTENGCSVMVQVVTGMDCTKSQRTDFSRDYPIAPVASNYKMPPKIPLLFYVPLLSNPVGHCFDSSIEGDYQHMMLGLGDIIAPGYLISYAFYLDVRKMNRFYLYGLTSLFGKSYFSFKIHNLFQDMLLE
jgi:signal peptide peptidase-like protein 2B